jgi:sulfide:quinone oxidoreductase
VLIVGGSFAGLTAAYALKRSLRSGVDVTVIARQRDFVFIPSLIWVAPGKRTAEQVAFELKPRLEAKGVHFVEARLDAIDAANKSVTTDQGTMDYDYLVLATGPKLEWDAIPGLGPKHGYTHSVCSLPEAIEANVAWEEFLKDPGPVVVGAAQGASCFGAGYEVVLNLEHALRKAGVRDKAPITFITSEPFLGHFGLGGLGKGEAMLTEFFGRRNINAIANTSVTKVEAESVVLSNGTVLPYKYAIIIPPFLGIDAIRDSPNLCNARGFVPVNDRYQHVDYPEIYSAGVAVAVAPPSPTEVPTGVPKTGYMAEVMGHLVAHNIAAQISGTPSEEKKFGDINALCILDAGDSGVIMLTDKIFAPRKMEWLIPGPWAHWGKLAFEKYFLWKMRHGAVYMP